jgi:WhiB family redox-sensing transcriptional regulator
MLEHVDNGKFSAEGFNSDSVNIMLDQAITKEEYYRDEREPVVINSIKAENKGFVSVGAIYAKGYESVKSTGNQLTEKQINFLSIRSLAKCAGVSTEVFFVDTEAESIAAKEICQDCIIKDDCLEYAIDGKEKFGVWGGLTPKERIQESKKRSDI